MTKRSIAPIPLLDVTPRPPVGARPEITWINPCDVLIEERYQRGVGDRGRKLIATIYGNFDWRLWRLPLAVWTEDGLEAIDGQHSLIAAACLGLAEVPIMVVEASDLSSRAELFVSANRDRLAVTRGQMHAAAVLAGDPDALAIERLCARFGIKILKATPFEGKYRPRETQAVASIAALIRRYAEDDVATMLGTLAEMDATPISVVLIKAVELLLTDPEFVGEIAPADITEAALSLDGFGEQEAKLFAATHRVPQWRALASVWFRAAKKLPRRRKVDEHLAVAGGLSKSPLPLKIGPEVNGISKTATGGHIIDRRPASRIVELGDLPGPGRSALDQRRASQSPSERGLTG